MNKRSCIFCTLFLTVILSLCIGSKAKGSAEVPGVGSEYVELREEEYVEGVKNTLEENGYSNSGVSITKVVDGEHIEYTVSVHHKRIDKMNEIQRRELSDILLDREPIMEGAVIRVKYIEYV